jgi:serine protease Do
MNMVIRKKLNVLRLKMFAPFLIVFLVDMIRLEAGEVPQSFADLVQELSPAVVNITTTTLESGQQKFNPRIPPGSPLEDFFKEFQDRNVPQNGPERQRRRSALGSGFIISSDGFVVTNNHVIENADEIEIEMTDGTLIDAIVFGRDKNTDIALLKMEVSKDLPFVEFGNSETARVGDWVLAIGNPLGQGFSVSAGIISARGRYLSGRYDDFIQTDAAINRGNSGGPLFDMNGKVIGVNTAILSPNGGSIGIGFSMSASVVGKVVDQLKEFGEIRRGWLGVRIQDITEDVAEALDLTTNKGALVTDVPDGPAKDAGIKSGDIIMEFDSQIVDSTRGLIRIVGDTEVGKSVNLKLLREGKKLTVSVVLGQLVDDMAVVGSKPKEIDKKIVILGMTVTNISEKNRSDLSLDENVRGVIVSEVEVDSSAAIKGVVTGDIITKIGQLEINSASEFSDAVAALKKSNRSSALLLIYRNGARRFVALPIN